jgi:GT2 family glycosyltransferase
MPKEIQYITWVGDDDLISPDALGTAVRLLEVPEKPVLVFGHCQYINSDGKDVLVKRTGSWAVPLLHFGPQLIPQSSAVFRRDAFELVGGLSVKYDFAFDFDLFLRLSKIGKSVYVNKITSSHRWHSSSLTFSRRWESVKEASKVRVSNLPAFARVFSFVWELPVVLVTYFAGHFASKLSILSRSQV